MSGGDEVAAAQYQRDLETVDSSRREFYDAIRKAHSEGIPATKIAEAAGLSAERVRQVVAGD